jgi:hypothetical protein
MTADLIARNANEGDTRLLVTDFLCDGLGYDKYEDLTTEGGPTHKADVLFHLSKEAFKRHIIDDLWRVKAATSQVARGRHHQRHNH